MVVGLMAWLGLVARLVLAGALVAGCAGNTAAPGSVGAAGSSATGSAGAGGASGGADRGDKRVMFARKTARYIRLVALSEISGMAFASVAELDVIGAAP